MIPTKREFSVLVLLVLISLVSSRPYQRSKRAIVKDYLNPLTYPTIAVQFEKGEDGKYHPLPPDPKVDYALAQKTEDNVIAEVVKSTDPKGIGAIDVERKEEVSSGSTSEDVLEELAKISSDNPTKYQEDETVKKESTEDTKLTEFGEVEVGHKSVFEPKSEEIDKKLDGNTKSSFSLVKQEDHKLQFMPKPDGKDDQPYEMQLSPEEYLPVSSRAPEKKEGTGKLAIGQIPFFNRMSFIARGIPVFLPERSFSFRVMSKLPVPPTFQISDRLPMPEAEVFEESSETAVIENVDPVSGVVRGERRTVADQFRSPISPGFSLPLTTMKKAIKELVDGQTPKGKARSQIVDVMGKKMLLQNKVLKYPTDDESHMYVGVMSVEPLEEVDPAYLKKLGLGKDVLGGDKTHRETEGKRQEEKEAKEKSIPSFVVDEVPINLSAEKEGSAIEVRKLHDEADVLKVEESRVDEKTDTSVAVTTGITSVVKEMTTESKTGLEDPVPIEKDSPKTEDFNKAEKNTGLEAEKHQELDDKVEGRKELNEVEMKNAPQEKIKNEPMENNEKGQLDADDEVQDDAPAYSDNKSEFPVSLDSEWKEKDIEDTKLEAESKAVEFTAKTEKDSKVTQNDDASTEGEDLLKENDGKASDGIDKAHELPLSTELKDGDGGVKVDSVLFKSSDGALEKTDTQIQGIDLTKEDGIPFDPERKKKSIEQSNTKETSTSTSKDKKCMCEKESESDESDSDSEDE